MNIITGFDNRFLEGVFTEPSANIPLYDFKRMRAYCDEKGITTSKLTEKEIAQFQIVQPK